MITAMHSMTESSRDSDDNWVGIYIYIYVCMYS